MVSNTSLPQHVNCRVLMATHREKAQQFVLKEIPVRVQKGVKEKLSSTVKDLNSKMGTNLVEVTGLFVEKENMYVVSAFHSQGNLQGWLKDGKGPKKDGITKMISKLAGAINNIHKRHAVLRFMDPSCVYTGSELLIGNMDLILMGIVDPDGFLPDVAYLAPEQVREGVSVADGSAIDVWAFGCIMFEIMFGVTLYEAMFQQRDDVEIRQFLLNSSETVDSIDFRELCEKRGHPEQYAQILEVCLRKSKDDRASMNEVVKLVERVGSTTVKMPSNPMTAQEGMLTHSKSFVGHDGMIVAMTGAGRYIFSGGGDAKIKMWDVRKQEQKGVFHGHTSTIWSLCVVGDKLYSGGDDGEVKIWNVKTQREVKSIKAHNEKVHAIGVVQKGFSGMLFTTGSDRVIKAWDLSKYEEEGAYTGHAGPVRALASDSKDFTVASGSADRSVRVWDITRGGQCSHTFMGHSRDVWSLYKMDRILFSGAADTTIKLWDPRANGEVGTLHGHNDTVISLTEVNNKLLSSSKDCTIKLWDLRAMECLETVPMETEPFALFGLDDNLFSSADRAVACFAASWKRERKKKGGGDGDD